MKSNWPEQRAHKYWAKHAARFGNNPFYLAVETSKIFPGDVHGLSPKLNHSETTASNRRRSYSYLELKGVMIFDTRTGHFAGNRGFISVDTPQDVRLSPTAVASTRTT
jgi:hypothetical protein